MATPSPAVRPIPAVLAVSLVLVMLPALPALGFAPNAEAGEQSTEASPEMISASTASSQVDGPVQCNNRQIQPAVGCSYCNQDNCGCLEIEGCVLQYDCTCSPIQCTRSCRYLYCVP